MKVFGSSKREPLQLPSSPHHIQAQNDHLCMGMTIDAVKDFLCHVGWPGVYERSDDGVARNGPMQSVKGQPQVMGYDLAAFIRQWLCDQHYERFSVAEVLMSGGHPGVTQTADIFLSHCQVELVDTTLDAMSKVCNPWSNPAFFLDYFIVRQAQPNDCSPSSVKEAIGRIQNTVVVLNPHVQPWPSIRPPCTYKPEAICRLWCAFELLCSIETGAKISGVFTLAGLQCLDPKTSDEISLQHCQFHSEDSVMQQVKVQFDRRNDGQKEEEDRLLRMRVRKASAAAAWRLIVQRFLPFAVLLPCVIFMVAYIVLYAYGNNGYSERVVIYYLCRQLLLVMSLSAALAEMKISCRGFCKLCSEFLSSRRGWQWILGSIFLIAFLIVLTPNTLLGFIAFFFFWPCFVFSVLRLVRCCFCCLKSHASGTWLCVHSWYASQRDFLVIVAALALVDIMYLSLPTDFNLPGPVIVKVLWYNLSLPLLLLLRVLSAKRLQRQRSTDSHSPASRDLPTNDAPLLSMQPLAAPFRNTV